MATPTSNSVPTEFVYPLLDKPGNALIYGDYFEGVKWGAGGLGTGVTLTYSFPTSASLFINDYGYQSYEPDNFHALDSTARAAARAALTAWSNIANVTFQEVTTENASQVGEIRFGLSDSLPFREVAHAYLPGDYVEAGDVWLNPDYWNKHGAPNAGSYDFQTLLHELGHSLGLSHTFDSSGYPDSRDSYLYSVMSYTSFPGSFGDYATLYPTTPMYDDMVAVQTLYGVNTTYRAGDNIYTFNQGTKYFQTIYDAGGNDTIVFNGSRAVNINLNDGAFSSLSDQIDFGYSADLIFKSSYSTVAIGPNTIIENATGGSGADVLTGNSANNVLNGGVGADRMVGRIGDDSYYIDNAADVAVENPGEGTDRIYSTLTWTIGANFENLTLIGTAAINAIGNSVANGLIGNSASNIFVGYEGADTMSGGGGDDVYYVNSLGDVVAENAGGGLTASSPGSISR